MCATTTQTDNTWPSESKNVIMYKPVETAKQIFLYASKKTGKNVWVQVMVRPEVQDITGKVCTV